MKMYLGIDVGATHIKVATGKNGKLESKVDFPTKKFDSSLQEIKRAVQKLATGHKIERIGLGVPGPLEIKTNRIVRHPRLIGWQNINLTEIFSETLQTPVVVAHDASAAALGEFIYGAGRGKNPVCYTTVSTGIGVGLVVDGKIYTGTHNPEAGQQLLGINSIKCTCGQKADLEVFASGAELEKRTGKKPVDLEDSKIWAEAMEWLGIGIANLILHYAPEIVVIGGGMTKHPQVLFPLVKASLKKHLHALPLVPVVPSGLGQDSGLIGCIALAEKG